MNDNTFHSSGANLETVLENLKHDTRTLFYWFRTNSMKANTFTIDESDEVELLAEADLGLLQHSRWS